MVRKILFIILLSISSLCLKGQNYVFEYDVSFNYNDSRRRYYNNLYIYTEKGGEKELSDFYFEKSHEGRRVKGKYKSPAKLGPIKAIKTLSRRTVRVIIYVDDSSGTRESFQYKASQGQTEYEFLQGSEIKWGILGLEKELSTVDTHVFKVYPDLYFVKEDQLLSSFSYKNKLSIDAIKGFPARVYKWQYSLDNGVSWHFIPSNLIDSSNPEKLSISGEDLVNKDEFIEHVLKQDKLQIRIFNPVQSSKILIFDLTLSSPYIENIKSESPKCHGGGDGKVVFTLSRPLYEGEILEVYQNDILLKFGEDSRVTLNSKNQFEVNNLLPGKYECQLKGSLANRNSSRIKTYSDSQKHKASIEVSEQPEIKASVSVTPVNCYDGSDGSISVRCSGGTNSFNVSIKDKAKKMITLKGNSRNPIIFRNLEAGTYKIYLLDSNNCTMGNSSFLKEVEIAQPPQPVSIESVSKISPLAHNSSDGLISIAVRGGTPKQGNSGYTVVWKNEEGEILSNVSVEKGIDSYTYTLNEIPAGFYIVSVTDTRYSLLSPQEKESPCGCSTGQGIELTAPPPLLVSVEETHFINCFGSNEGELTATGKGGVILSPDAPYKYQWYEVSNNKEILLKGENNRILKNRTVGEYFVQITDANGITARSKFHSLKQPLVLEVSFEKTTPKCSSELGKIKAIVKGGTPPYSYTWNIEGENTSILNNIPADNYFLHIEDSRGCTLDQSVELVSPSALRVVPTIVHPTCNGEDNGSIKLEIEGATPPYTVQWEDSNIESHQRNNLPAGIYKVTISDSQACPVHLELKLEEPDPIELSISSPFTLCKGQSGIVKAFCSEKDVEYTWFLDGKLLSSKQSELAISQEGFYEVEAKTPNQCTARTGVKIDVAENDFILDIAIPSIIEQGAEVHAVNISKSKGARLEWKLPKEATLIESNNEEAVFTIPSLGTYFITVLAHTNNCTIEMVQKIEVKPSTQLKFRDNSKEPLIKKFVVSPNPTKGIFKVKIELREPIDCSLNLYTINGQFLKEFSYKKIKEKIQDFDISNFSSGTYLLKLSTKEEQSVLKVELY